MKKSAAKEQKINKTRVVVRDLPPNSEADVRGGMVVTKVLDIVTTN